MKFSPRRPRWKYSKRKIVPVIAVIQKKVSSSSSRSASSKESLRPASPSVKPMPSATLKPLVKQRTRSTIDYKNVSLLRKCITGEGKIFPRRLTRVTSKQQRYIENAIKKARILGLLPFINISRPSRFWLLFNLWQRKAWLSAKKSAIDWLYNIEAGVKLFNNESSRLIFLKKSWRSIENYRTYPAMVLRFGFITVAFWPVARRAFLGILASRAMCYVKWCMIACCPG